MRTFRNQTVTEFENGNEVTRLFVGLEFQKLGAHLCLISPA